MTFPLLGSRVRRSRPEDVDQLADLFFEFYTRFNLEQTLSGVPKELIRVDNARQFSVDTISSYFTADHLMFVAQQGAKLVGYIAGTTKVEPHYVYSPEAEIIDWFVTENSRSQGVGQQLFQSFVDEVKAQGCKALVLEAFSQNVRGIQTYEKMGFVQDSVILKKIL